MDFTFQVIGYPLFSFWFHDATASGAATALPFTVSAVLMMFVAFGAWATACNDSGGCRICADRPFGRRAEGAAVDEGEALMEELSA